jgi:hypothetical protein
MYSWSASQMIESWLMVIQVINGIQTGPYKNIYNPENFFVGKNGVGAANNWGDGYQTGELVHEDIMEMIDREADGSDSLEVRCVQIFIRITTTDMKRGS